VLLVPAATTHVTPIFRNIVCAVDLSSRSTAMITNVLPFTDNNGRLTVLHVLRHRYGRFGIAWLSRATALGPRQRLQALLDTLALKSEHVQDGPQHQGRGKRKRRQQRLRSDDDRRREIERQARAVPQHGAGGDLDQTQCGTREQSGASAVHCHFP
jgi:hypothetical protein